MGDYSTSGLLKRLDYRFRQEWPGPHSTKDGRDFWAPGVREGGATEAALNFMLDILQEELEK